MVSNTSTSSASCTETWSQVSGANALSLHQSDLTWTHVASTDKLLLAHGCSPSRPVWVLWAVAGREHLAVRWDTRCHHQDHRLWARCAVDRDQSVQMVGVTQVADETDAARRDAVGGGEKMVWQARRWASQTWTSVIIRISNWCRRTSQSNTSGSWSKRHSMTITHLNTTRARLIWTSILTSSKTCNL